MCTLHSQKCIKLSLERDVNIRHAHHELRQQFKEVKLHLKSTDCSVVYFARLDDNLTVQDKGGIIRLCSHKTTTTDVRTNSSMKMILCASIALILSLEPSSSCYCFCNNICDLFRTQFRLQNKLVNIFTFSKSSSFKWCRSSCILYKAVYRKCVLVAKRHGATLAQTYLKHNTNLQQKRLPV